jgi:hypothetical protein
MTGARARGHRRWVPQPGPGARRPSTRIRRTWEVMSYLLSPQSYYAMRIDSCFCTLIPPSRVHPPLHAARYRKPPRCGDDTISQLTL